MCASYFNASHAYQIVLFSKKQKEEVESLEPRVIDLTQDDVNHEPIVEGQHVLAKQKKHCKHSHPAVILSIKGADATIMWLDTDVIEDIELKNAISMPSGAKRKKRQTNRFSSM